MKKTNNKPSVIKNIFVGVGILVGAVALILGFMVISPMLIVVASFVIHIGGWIVLFCVAVILPAWLIGKGHEMIKNKNKTKQEASPETAVYAEELNKLREEADMLRSDDEVQEEKETELKEAFDYKAYYEEKLKTKTDELKRVYKEKAKALKRDKNEELNKKVINVKNAVVALFK